MKKYLQVIRSSPLFSGVGKEEVGAMLSCLEALEKDFEKDSYIFRIGDTTASLGIVLSGSVLIVQEDFWGNRNIVSSVAQGQTFAETFACAPGSVMNVSVVAQTACKILFLNVKRILHTCPSSCSHHNKMIQNLLSSLAVNNLRQNEKLSHLAQRTTRAKLLSYLSAMAQQHSSFEFDIPYSRQQLADYLSVERSGLSLELGKMRKEGLLDFHKNHFVLLQQPG
ncbi:MAG TPA: Crp/Fnr family transcriptional regulator [Candidatus Merdisoma merdipullorum]|nr:Crp/Fnr family transcriptional regulator [Candidatus Merdisoma merdipullorum]